MRLPFFYGWIIVAVTFVTMAIGVTARTSFSLLFPADHRGVRLGTRGHGGSLFVWLSGFGSAEPADRPDDGSPWSSRRHGAWRHPDGRRLAAGAADDAAMASLPDDWRAGRRRKRLPRLLRSIAVSAQLVRAPARARNGHCVRGRRHRLHHHAALGADHDRANRMADGLYGDGHSGSGRAGADQSVVAEAAGGDGA